MYLSESLTVKEMYKMFLAAYFINIPYKLYWHIFRSKFNIKFEYPRSDTCADCDSFLHKFNNKNITDEEKSRLLMQKKLHLRKTETFRNIKTNYKVIAQSGGILCLLLDFKQNLSFPHIRTNYYFIFGVHDLGSNE